MPRRKRKPVPTQPVRAEVEALTHDGRGVAHIEGKATFIDGALPGEEVMFTYTLQRKHYDEGVIRGVLRASPDRVAPACPHFGMCGGCSLQHLSADAQIRTKAGQLQDNLQRIGRLAPESWLPPLTGPHWGYRRKARLGVKYVIKKSSLLVGFREKKSAYLAELKRCDVLHPKVGANIMALRELIGGLDGYARIPQIEVAAGDDTVGLVFRHLDPLSEADLGRLHAFGETHAFLIYLQPGGPGTVRPLWPLNASLSYRLPAHEIEFEFLPTDFTQVNGDLNRAMIDHALGLLAPHPEDHVLDFFCGLGNFTLPLARRTAQVIGVEGDAALVARARDNARRNGIDNAVFHAADLSEPDAPWPWAERRFDKILLDPPRTGALEVVKRLAALGAERIVYVSCNPATFARDAAGLVHGHGYRLARAGVMDMFPHTTHVECIALFLRD